MRKLEWIILYVFLGAVAPIAFFLTFWWSSFRYVAEGMIPAVAITGLLVGIILDVIFLKRWVKRAYQLNLGWLIAIYLFYSIGVFGFFMGVPIFNLAVGITAGYYIGRRSYHGKLASPKKEQLIRQTAVFAVLVLAVLSTISAYWALSDSSVGANLEGMFHLPFSVTKTMIVGIILVGGIASLILQYFLTQKTALWAVRGEPGS